MNKLLYRLFYYKALLLALTLPGLLWLSMRGSLPVTPAIIGAELLLRLNLLQHSQLYYGLSTLLIMLNILLTYWLCSRWFGSRRAQISVLILTCIPIWLIIQTVYLHIAVIYAAIMLAKASFDEAGRSNRPSLWYALCGLSISVAWVIEPVAITLLALIGAAVLVVSKPRLARAIVRQASLVPIVLIIIVTAIAVASSKFDWTIHRYIAQRLTQSITPQLQLGLLLSGPHSGHLGIAGLGMIPPAVAALALLGGWSYYVGRKRARNRFILLYVPALLIVATQLQGGAALIMTLMMLLGISLWTTHGIEYLRNAWYRLFPVNQFVRSIGRYSLCVLIISLAIYSYWYCSHAWANNPQTSIDLQTTWDGKL